MSSQPTRSSRTLTLVERRELEPGVLDETQEFLVARRLPVLAVRLRRVELVLSLEAHSLDDRVRDILDRHLLVLADRENERLNVVVVAQLPDEELREVARVNELPERLARAPDDERRVVLYRDIDGEREATDGDIWERCDEHKEAGRGQKAAYSEQGSTCGLEQGEHARSGDRCNAAPSP